jgi:hypothetical protein
MRSLPLLLPFVILAACGAPAEEQTTPEAATPAPRSIADFAGTWEGMAMIEGVADPVPVTTSGDAAGVWTMSVTDRPDVPLHASLRGDTLVTESEEFESVLRPGSMVVVRSANVLEDDAMVGAVLLTYRTEAGEETVAGTLRSTRLD